MLVLSSRPRARLLNPGYYIIGLPPPQIFSFTPPPPPPPPHPPPPPPPPPLEQCQNLQGLSFQIYVGLQANYQLQFACYVCIENSSVSEMYDICVNSGDKLC